MKLYQAITCHRPLYSEFCKEMLSILSFQIITLMVNIPNLVVTARNYLGHFKRLSATFEISSKL